MAFTPRWNTLSAILEDSVAAYGNRKLFGVKRQGSWSWTTYRDFARDVERFRGALAHLGVGRGDLVAVVANNRPEWAVGEYACFGLGAAYVPMYEAQASKEWEFILKDCGAKVLMVANKDILDNARGFLDTVPSLKHIVLIDGDVAEKNGKADRIHPYRALLEGGFEAKAQVSEKDDVACLIYTSGTTGNPKGVMLTHGNIANNVSAARSIFPFENEDCSLSFLPWAHVFGQTVELHAMISAGASMGIAESVEKILDNLAEVQPTVLFSVPRIFNKIYAAVQKQLAAKPKPIQELVKQALQATAKERSGVRLSVKEHMLLHLVDRVVFSKVRARFGGRLKFAASGGAAISKEVAEFIDSLGITVFEGYGLTETSPIATMNSPGSRVIGSVGRNIPGVRIEIDPSVVTEKKVARNLLTDPVEGEILVYGHNVMKGYHNRPEENAAVFTKDGGFRTGDMGYLDGRGFLFITGRIKEQYKLENGKYVVPTPLEESLKLSPYVLNGMVYGDNRPFNVALLVANVAALQEWAKGQGIDIGSGDALLQNEKVRELFKGEIDRLSANFKGFEAIRDFALVGTDFTPENGLLTPSQKLKRRKVLEVYGHLIDGLYGKGKPKASSASQSSTN